MTESNGQSSAEEAVRAAVAAFAGNDRDAIVELIDRDFTWLFFDPYEDTPILHTCRGRSEIAKRMGRNPPGGGWELVEVEPFGQRVAVVTRSPDGESRFSWRSGDLNFHVVEVRDGRVAILRSCRDRDEALRLAAAEGESLSI